eukprot:TRINITY_DN2636_c0_g1_i1.p1 TRINITY_DN2636_c0_g1~~TRINITY_DN2636_c0_g1_i1.p1  ORF type:complete len:123 (+),score=18.07 TRINITY_DN2636_c0_g1_i1:199-567(+)
MKILTHNMIMCNKKGCSENNFPLKIVATVVDKQEIEFQPDFIKRLITNLSWPGIVSAAKDLNFPIPEELPEGAAQDENFLKNLHEVLNEVQINTGELICPNCSRSFPIENGIPNMLLNEDEV